MLARDLGKSVRTSISDNMLQPPKKDARQVLPIRRIPRACDHNEALRAFVVARVAICLLGDVFELGEFAPVGQSERIISADPDWRPLVIPKRGLRPGRRCRYEDAVVDQIALNPDAPHSEETRQKSARNQNRAAVEPRYSRK